MFFPESTNRLENDTLVTLLKNFNSIPMDIEGDAFGKIYEYFLGNFAMKTGGFDEAKRGPDDTLIHFVWAPGIEALTSLRHGDAEHAIQVLGPAAQYDRATLDPMLVRANAYLGANRPAEAVEGFQRILVLKASFPYDPTCWLAQLGLARPYDVAGDRARSLAAYQDFLALWKNADPISRS